MIIEKTDIFDEWLKKLKDKKSKSRILARLYRIETTNNLGDYKSISDNIFELRIDCGAGYRIYFIFNENKIILLLCGGNKSSQQKDIEKAKFINKQRGYCYGKYYKI